MGALIAGMHGLRESLAFRAAHLVATVCIEPTERFISRFVGVRCVLIPHIVILLNSSAAAS